MASKLDGIVEKYMAKEKRIELEDIETGTMQNGTQTENSMFIRAPMRSGAIFKWHNVHIFGAPKNGREAEKNILRNNV